MSSDPAPGEPPVEDPIDESGACEHTEYVEGEPREAYPATGADAEGVAADVWAVLYDVEDPEMPVSIVDLGLIYGVDVETPTEPRGDGGAHVTVEMTLTYTGCPARTYLTEEIEAAVAAVEGVESVDLQLVWSPPWSLEMVTDAGREQLGEFGLSV